MHDQMFFHILKEFNEAKQLKQVKSSTFVGGFLNHHFLMHVNLNLCLYI